jgi:hypothetical protein
VRHTVVLELDLVRDVTVVDVRFQTFPPRRTVRQPDPARPLARVAS